MTVCVGKRSQGMGARVKRAGYAGGAAASLVLIAGSLGHWLPLDITEVLGFVTGAWDVWLTVEESIWNWPLGIANNLFFLVLFVQARLFADSSLQVVYIVLGALGWYWWLRGGTGHGRLPIACTRAATATILGVILVVATAIMTVGLERVHDAAPFWDALTTVLSLIAQYMLTRKLLENWLVWLSADVIYVALYIYKGLDLTAGLYTIFIVMCVAGLRRWQATLREARPGASSAIEEAAHA